MASLAAGNGVCRTFKEALRPPRTIDDGIDPEADGRPRLRPRRGSRVLHGPEVSLEEQAVNIDPDILMIEGQGGGTREVEPVCGRRLPCAPRLTRGLARKKHRPSLLQKREEGRPIG